MTNLRLETEMFDDINFCPFCGKSLVLTKLMDGGTAKDCPGTFHFLVLRSEQTEVV